MTSREFREPHSGEPESHAPRKRSRSPKRDEPIVFSPGIVTALRALDTRGARFGLELGGVYGVVSAALIGEFKLARGAVVDANDAVALTDAVRKLAVFDLAVAMLSRRSRSVRDLRMRLRRRGASDADVQATVERLTELGLLDDAAFARHMAESRAANGGVSKRRLQQELRRRGVAHDVSEAAVADALGESALDEHAAATEVARKRARSLKSLDPAVAKRRLFAFLLRRGYPSGVIKRAVREVLGEHGDLEELEHGD